MPDEFPAVHAVAQELQVFAAEKHSAFVQCPDIFVKVDKNVINANVCLLPESPNFYRLQYLGSGNYKYEYRFEI